MIFRLPQVHMYIYVTRIGEIYHLSFTNLKIILTIGSCSKVQCPFT